MNRIISEYITHKTDKTLIQFLKYILAGGLAAVVDIGFFMFLVKIFSLDYRIAVFLSFTFGTITNFLISNAFIFNRETLSFWTAGFRHYISSLGGLAANEAVLILLVETIKFDNLFFSKLIATGAAFLVNFTLIKYFAFNSRVKLTKKNTHE
jgi:putative flippase GtrA